MRFSNSSMRFGVFTLSLAAVLSLTVWLIPTSTASPMQGGGMPPGFAEVESATGSVPMAPRAQQNLQQLEERLAGLPGGKEHLENVRANRGNPEPAVRQAPPGLAQMELHVRSTQLPPQATANMQQLMTRLQSLPGGREQAEEARKNAGKPSAGNYWLEMRDRLHSVSPLLTVHAFQDDDEVISSKVFRKFLLSDDRLDMHNLKTTEKLYFYGATEDKFSATRPYTYFPSKTKLGDGTVARNNVKQRITVPRTAWYLTNVEKYSSAAARPIKLSKWDGSQYKVQSTFSSAAGWAQYPRYLYLKAGTHYLNWSVDEKASGSDWTTKTSIREYLGTFNKEYKRARASLSSKDFQLADKEGSVVLEGVLEYDQSPKNTSARADNSAIYLDDGTRAEKRMILKARVPVSGYYMTSAKMLHYSSQTMVKVAAWDPATSRYKTRANYPAAAGMWAEYPAVQYLKAGDNYLLWTTQQANSAMAAANVTIQSMVK